MSFKSGYVKTIKERKDINLNINININNNLKKQKINNLKNKSQALLGLASQVNSLGPFCQGLCT